MLPLAEPPFTRICRVVVQVGVQEGTPNRGVAFLGRPNAFRRTTRPDPAKLVKVTVILEVLLVPETGLITVAKDEDTDAE